jgi:hypothetical protein
MSTVAPEKNTKMGKPDNFRPIRAEDFLHPPAFEQLKSGKRKRRYDLPKLRPSIQ